MKPVMNAIGMVVSDMSATVEFYERLGLSFSDEGEEHRECELSGGMRLMLDTVEVVRRLYPEWTKPTGGSRISLALQMDSTMSVDEKYLELTKAGSQSVHEPWDAFWGQRY
ncbi:MAG: VOC family protein, partial [Longispora sp.]|nr:VOC family protein [Longispora sp. (in: high G+C Gram-positive bacteria)]